MITSYDTLVERIRKYTPDVAIVSIVDILENLLTSLHVDFPFRRVSVDTKYLEGGTADKVVLITNKSIDGYECLVCSEELLRGM